MKKIIFGIIIGVLLAISVPVAAEGIIKKVTATIRSDFSIELNGESVTLKNSPLAYNGNSYLPVRELASLLGTDVDFKDGVIKLDTPSEEDAIATKDEYDKELGKHERTIAEYEKGLESAKTLLAHLETADNTRPEDIELAKKQIAEYETIITKAKQSIADLKAKYPEYTK